MWLFETINGGCYRHIRSNWEPSKEFENIINWYRFNGIQFRVYFHEYEYQGWYHDVYLINDETLDEIYVDHHIAWEHNGVPSYGITTGYGCYERTIWDSEKGNIALQQAEALKACVNNTILCLPAPETVRAETLAEQLCHARLMYDFSYAMPKLLSTGVYDAQTIVEKFHHFSYEECLQSVLKEKEEYPYGWKSIIECTIKSLESHPTWEEEQQCNSADDDVMVL